MDVEDIRRARNAKPFVPFTLVVSDGRRLRVDEPFGIAISPRGNEVCATEDNFPAFVAVSQIVAVEIDGPNRPKVSA